MSDVDVDENQNYQYSDEESERSRSRSPPRRLPPQPIIPSEEEEPPRIEDMCVICYCPKSNCSIPTDILTTDPSYDLLMDKSYKVGQEGAMEARNYARARLFTNKRVCVRLECSHSYHWGCIYQHVNTTLATQARVGCPECRAQLSQTYIDRLGYTSVDNFQQYDPAVWEGLTGGRRTRRSNRAWRS